MALDPTWQIGVAGGTLAQASSLGITELQRRRASQTIDTVAVTIGGGDVDAAAIFSFGASIEIACDGALWFLGRVTKTPASGSGTAQSQTVELSGPWWYLENLVCRQQWQVLGATQTALLSRLILGQGPDGTPITTGAVMTEALNYAVNAGAPFQLGTILTGFTIPFDEVKDVTCGEVVRKMLRWHPDAVTWFDYTTSPPTLYIQERSALNTATVTFGEAPLTAIGEITPRNDLQAPAVVIHYEVTTTINGSTQINVVTDAAPAGATGNDFGGIVLTIPLRGESATTTENPVQVRAIIDSAASSGALEYLTSIYAGELATARADPSITADGITITSVSRGLADSADEKFDPTTGQFLPDPDYDASLTNQLVQGTVTGWMASQFAVKSQRHRIVFSYTTGSGSGDADAAPGNSDVSDPKQGTVDITATNATTQLYTTITSYTAGDSAPLGLAANYLAVLTTLQWSGSVTLEEQVPGTAVPAASLGALLNITGSSNSAWSSMNALVVEEMVWAAMGRTVLTFGPARYLSPQDLVERLRTTRPGGLGGRDGTGALGTDHSDSRKSGNPPGNKVGLGAAHPIQNGVPVPSQAALGRNYFNGVANGFPVVFLINGTTVAALPDGSPVLNPD